MTSPAIACSLSATDLPARLREWRSLLSSVVERTGFDGGVRLRFGPGIRAADVAGLASRELECCPFFTFGLLMSSAGLVMEVRAPEGAEALVNALLDEAPAPLKCGCSST
jgi:hypothetical protein